MSPVRAGMLFVAIVGVFVFFGFSKVNPFSNHFELKAQFQSAQNLKNKKSEVRIAGVEVGRIKSVESLSADSPGALVTMEIEKSGLPIHSDAELKVRPLLFLEGNYFVDLKPGSPSAPVVEDGHTVPITQTAIPVQFGDLLTALQSDTRKDLRTLLSEYAFKGLNGGGAEGFNGSIEYWEPAYRSSALVNDATLGTRPGDLRKVVGGQQKTLAALVDNEDALQGTITNLNVTANALAREDDALEAAIPALNDVLTAGPPALRALNASLPSVSRFAKDALPGVRSSGPTLDALIPFVSQLRALVQPSELRGLVDDLRPTIPALTRLNQRTVPILAESRALSACTNNVINPFMESPIPNPDPQEGGDRDNNPNNNGGGKTNDDQLVMRQLPRSLVGLAGESRISDANSPQFRVNTSGGNQGLFFDGSTGGDTFAAVPNGVSGTRPALPTSDWDFRPDVPCETQEPPNLEAPLGRATGTEALTKQTGKLKQPPLTVPEIIELAERLSLLGGASSAERCRVEMTLELEGYRIGKDGKPTKTGKPRQPVTPPARAAALEKCKKGKRGKAEARAQGPGAPAKPGPPRPAPGQKGAG
ncbi:MAG: MCE family protein [Nocardioidaceae bacterium]|nr:MCE family protein [Nocardioidaceae bacterium]